MVPVLGMNIQVKFCRLGYVFVQSGQQSELVMPLLREVRATGPVPNSHSQPELCVAQQTRTCFLYVNFL